MTFNAGKLNGVELSGIITDAMDMDKSLRITSSVPVLFVHIWTDDLMTCRALMDYKNLFNA